MLSTIQQFINYLNYEKHFSAHTIIAYQKDLDQFSSFVQQQFEIDTPNIISHQHIRTWLVDLMNNNNEPRSVARKLSALRSYFKYLLKEEIVTNNPVAKVQAPKVAKKLPTFIEEQNINKLFDLEFKNNENEVMFNKDFELKIFASNSIYPSVNNITSALISSHPNVFYFDEIKPSPKRNLKIVSL
jgi:site-specific recombinase XerD